MKIQAPVVFVRQKIIKLRQYFAAALLLTSIIFPLMPAASAYAANDDYPTKWKDAPMDSTLDSWREYNRECTSFVAWRLSTKNGFNMPFHDSASGWAADARARGYTVNYTPARGAVAWSSGHVAWVESYTTTTVTLEEYNETDSNQNNMYGDDGTYDERTVDIGAYQYIHFKDLTDATTSASPASYKGKMVRNSVGTISYVANNGIKYWVPNLTTMNCLGGSSAVVQLNNTQFNTIPSSSLTANCTTKYVDRMVRNSVGTISYVDTTNVKHWVPSGSVLNCLTAAGTGSFLQIDNATFNTIPSVPTNANCSSRYMGRMGIEPDGTVSYIDITETKHWIPNSDTVNCLGGWGAVMSISAGSASAMIGSAYADCNTDSLGRMYRAPGGIVYYLASAGDLHLLPDAATTSCLGSSNSVINIDYDPWGQYPLAAMATCQTR